jgi:asparagine synthase (glutamine-hydrolysing)
MCGVCGILGREDKNQIEKMLSVIRHRGPDDKGIIVDENISLGHARLSIIDLSEKGRQPISNEEGNVWLSVNGEIYNHKELRRELTSKGHIFHSNSDSEVIVHAYEEYGLEFVNQLRGMFAFALYDISKRRLVLVRDPIGKKPLYYWYDGDLLIFASEIKAILETGIPKVVNYDAIWGYLAYQYSLGENTLFKGILKLLPGTMLVTTNKNINFIKYWSLKENIFQADEYYFVKKLRTLLDESTQLRMVADVPIGAFLSGGLDSSAVTALGRKFSEGNFHTFSVGFETFSELEYARIVSQHLDTTHHEIEITDKMVLRELNKIAWHYDEPLGDAAIINNYFLSKEAKKEVKVVLAGEGGDELFAGYSNYRNNLKMVNMCSPGICRILEVISKYFPGFQRGNPLIQVSKPYAILEYLKYFIGNSIEEFHQNTTRTFSDDTIRSITTLTGNNVNDMVIYPKNVNTTLGKMLAMDCLNLLPEKYLMKADKGTMANSIEERLPLLDRFIIDFAFTIPPELKIKTNSVKYILKESVKDILPNEIINRPKVGFGTPVGHWMENELGEVVRQTINDGIFLKQILKPERKKEIENKLTSSFQNAPFQIWTLFALELWYEVYFRNKNF